MAEGSQVLSEGTQSRSNPCILILVMKHHVTYMLSHMARHKQMSVSDSLPKDSYHSNQM